MNSTDLAPAFSRALHLPQVKQAARRLADWTGLSLSESLELTARAYGAVNWNALLKEPPFCPDDALIDRTPPLRQSLVERYAALIQLLQARLHLSSFQAHLLAGMWRPTAANGGPGLFDLRFQLPSAVPLSPADKEVVRVFGEHPQLPEGAVLAVVADRMTGGAVKEWLVLVAVRPGRLARFLGQNDCLAVALDGQVGTRLGKSWDKDDLPEKVFFKQLEGALAKADALQLSAEFLANLSQPMPPVRLKAAWLRSPRLPDSYLLETFAELMPWSQRLYPELRGRGSTAFWSYSLPQGAHMVLGVYGGAVGVHIFEKGAWKYPKWGIQHLGAGGLQWSEATSEGKNSSWPQGYYLVKHATRIPGSLPIPGMTPELAAEVRKRTGLTGTDRDEGHYSWKQGKHTFYESEAGLALAKWCARHPERAREQRDLDIDHFIPDWWGGSLARMEFELARAGLLG